MCKIYERVFVDEDETRDVYEEIDFCPKALQGKFCSDVARKTTICETRRRLSVDVPLSNTLAKAKVPHAGISDTELDELVQEDLHSDSVMRTETLTHASRNSSTPATDAPSSIVTYSSNPSASSGFFARAMMQRNHGANPSSLSKAAYSISTDASYRTALSSFRVIVPLRPPEKVDLA